MDTVSSDSQLRLESSYPDSSSSQINSKSLQEITFVYPGRACSYLNVKSINIYHVTFISAVQGLILSVLGKLVKITDT